MTTQIRQSPPAANQGAESVVGGDRTSITARGPLPHRFIDPDQMFRRFMQDAFTEASVKQWRARAERFRAARPRPGDFVGNSTVEDRRDAWRRLTAIADACEAHALLIESGATWHEVENLSRGDLLEVVA